MQNSSLEELRRYVTAKDGQTRFGPGTLSLNISHSNLAQRWIEIRFEQDETIAAVKNKLYKHGGTAPEFQRLQLLDSFGKALGELADNRLSLRQYGVQNNMEIRIIDTDANSLAKSGWLEDTSLVEKYVMPDEVYEAREGTVRKFKQQLKEKEREAAATTESKAETVDENITLGKRCEVFPGGRRGEVKFVGPAESLGPGVWVGVALDEPLGKNDGSVKGKRFFTCPPNFGVLVKVENIRVGDYPVRDLEHGVDSDDEM